ncbi:xanthine dehydrogenase accessory protein XdhC [Nocardioides sp. GY 10113]|uniref:xanthine dehydrogenase accessory protein XdhC n=1 Tax=Nocardioides sp. GY 10113 TaxID=2569761 RepID=UPI001F0E8CE9|nr:xanthine dehydrogenase accessory protein XdhC [Nocardioides sp. GY 10113]
MTSLRRDRLPGALVTVVQARGHAPRDAGAKMVVGPDRTWGSIGGGNVEEIAIRRAREVSGADPSPEPETLTVALSDRAEYQHGVQCCGGEVTLLIEPLAVVPAVAIFGAGHVGLELARILGRFDLDLHLVDSRAEVLGSHDLAAAVAGAVAHVETRHFPVLPEAALAELPAGTHLLVMTHDHAEDLAICDAALRVPAHRRPASIGLIGSAAKWSRFRGQLRAAGHEDAEVEGRIRCPIGAGGVRSKEPAAIAVDVAAEVLALVERPADRRSAAELG